MPAEDLPGSQFETIPIDDTLVLRQLTSEDATTMFELLDKDRDNLEKWLGNLSSITRPSDYGRLIQRGFDDRNDGTEYGYGIVLDGQSVGQINLIPSDVNAEMMYWVASDYSGRGIAAKAVRALTTFGLEQLGLAKIIIQVERDNLASNAVARRAGYLFTGCCFGKTDFDLWSAGSNHFAGKTSEHS